MIVNFKSSAMVKMIADFDGGSWIEWGKGGINHTTESEIGLQVDTGFVMNRLYGVDGMVGLLLLLIRIFNWRQANEIGI